MEFNFTIYMTPVAQGRPRFFRRGNFTGVYDPKKSKSAKLAIAKESMKYKPTNPLEGAIHLYLKFYIARPKSVSKNIKYHIKRPDLDNLEKLLLDAFKGIMYNDDSQIVSCIKEKHYCEQGDMPRIEVYMKGLEER